MDNKLITVTSPLLPDLDEFQELLKQIWDSKWITNNGQFHRQLEQHPAHAVVALRCDGSHVGQERIGQIGSIILCIHTTNIILDCPFNKFRLALAMILTIVILYQLLCTWIDPQEEFLFSFWVCQNNASFVQKSQPP